MSYDYSFFYNNLLFFHECNLFSVWVLNIVTLKFFSVSCLYTFLLVFFSAFHFEGFSQITSHF